MTFKKARNLVNMTNGRRNPLGQWRQLEEFSNNVTYRSDVGVEEQLTNRVAVSPCESHT